MNTVTVFVGLDYHQDGVQVSVLDVQGKQLLKRSCRNNWRQIAAAVAPLGQVKRAAIEACCGAADLAEELVTHAGWHLEMAHPQYVARIKQSPDKSDYSDGRLLADPRTVSPHEPGDRIACCQQLMEASCWGLCPQTPASFRTAAVAGRGWEHQCDRLSK